MFVSPDVVHDADPDVHYDFFSDNNINSCQYYSLPDYCNINNNKSISIINHNIRSFNRNFDSLLTCFSPDNLPSILCLTETRFSHNNIENIPGYESFHTVRNSETPAGGISLFVSNEICSKKIETLSFSNNTIEICTVDINFNDVSITIIGVYRPHSDTVLNFNSCFSEILNNNILRNKFCIILGDFNICLLKDCESNLNFMNILYTNHFTPLISKATRFSPVAGEVPSLLDHIWINKLKSNVAGVLDIDITDHLPTFVRIYFNNVNSNEKIRIQFRVINDANKIKFKQLLYQFDWDSVKSNDADLFTDNLIETLNNLYCSAFPQKTKLVSNNNYMTPWITSSLKKLIEAKSNYFKLYKLSLVTLAENNIFRNKVNNAVRRHKIKYHAELFLRYKNDLKRTWKIINQVISRNRQTKNIRKIIFNNITYTNDEEIASIFNDFFCSIGENYDSDIPASSLNPCHFINTNHSSSLFLDPVSPFEVEYHIKNLKNSKQNLDYISIPILKENADYLSIIFADLINICFQTGTFPKRLKMAVVLPLFKKGDREILSNWRPISQLPPLSKLIEKCLKSRILSYFFSKKLFNEVQFGFQSGISTQDAIIYLTEKIYANLHSQISTLAVYIDFSKCFDTINRAILIRKLELYGVRGIALDLFKSYLSDRYQAVRVNGVISDFRVINTGVPQGSVLGPILYLIYVNELPSISHLFSMCLYADDTTLIFENKEKNELVSMCNEGIDIFYSWCCSNRLSINASKTNTMLFSNKIHPCDVLEIFMNNDRIEYASSVRFLGVIIDDKLKFNLHADDVAAKLSKNAGVMYKLREYVPHNTLLCVYRSFVESYLNYCILIFGNAYPTHIHSLKVAQKKCVRIIAHESPYAHSNPIFNTFKLLKFAEMYTYNLGIYMYKNIENFSANLFQSPYFSRSGTYYISTRQRLTLTSNQSIKVQALSNWNNIPDTLKNSPSVISFKKNYKKYLLSSYNE